MLERVLGPELGKMITGVVVFLFGFLTKVLYDTVILGYDRRYKKPRLELEFGHQDFTQRVASSGVQTTARPSTYKQRYIKLAVRNVNPEIAKDVRAYLVKVELPGGQGTDYEDNIPLISSLDRSVESVVLPKGVTRHFDLAVLNEGTLGFDMQFRDSAGNKLVPAAYVQLFGASPALRFTVLAGGDNCEPVTKSLAIEWNGTWPPTMKGITR